MLIHAKTLHAAQSRGFDQTLAKTLRALGELAATVARGKTRRDRTAVLAEITRITRPRWVDRVLTTELSAGPRRLLPRRGVTPPSSTADTPPYGSSGSPDEKRARCTAGRSWEEFSAGPSPR